MLVDGISLGQLPHFDISIPYMIYVRLAPYLRIPLLLGFLGTSQRVGALADDRLQGVLEAAVFEPGPWRSTTSPREVPKADP